MFLKKISLLVFLLAISLSITGCLKVNNKNKSKNIPDGGMYVSVDKGDNWEQRTAVLSTGGTAANFSMDSVSAIALDKNDPETIYFGTVNQGLLYSLDRGLKWQLVYDLGRGTVNAIEVDPKNKCKIYVAMNNNLSKSEDCARNWKTVFTDTVEHIVISSIAIDHFNPENIYISLSRGDLVKSTNGGKSWQTVYRFKKNAKNLVIDPSDSRRMYVDVAGEGLHFSNDSGASWTSLNQVFVDNKIVGNIVDIELVKEQPGLILVATELGILKSTDRGVKWELLKLLPPKANASIASMAINPKNVNELYYITNNTFYRSIDGGANWSPKPILGTKKAKVLMMDTSLPEVLYMGMSL